LASETSRAIAMEDVRDAIAKWWLLPEGEPHRRIESRGVV
jgi:hypothetical protein